MRHRGLVGGTATTTEGDEGGTQGRLPIYIKGEKSTAKTTIIPKQTLKNSRCRRFLINNRLKIGGF